MARSEVGGPRSEVGGRSEGANERHEAGSVARARSAVAFRRKEAQKDEGACDELFAVLALFCG